MAKKSLTEEETYDIIVELIASVHRNAGFAGVVQWQNPSLPSWSRGFDSHHPLHMRQ